MSLLNKNLREKITFVILCAGEGVRLKDVINSAPKPLLKIKSLKNNSILQNTISNLNKLEIEKIAIVKGHLGNKIDEFVALLTKNDDNLKEKLLIVDSGKEYKLGPLFSFLSFTKNKKVFLKNKVFVVIPGDTLFNFRLLKEITNYLLKTFNPIQEYPYSFYRIIKASKLKKNFNKKIISVSEIEKMGKMEFLKGINQIELQYLTKNAKVKQIFPLFVFSYNFIQDIIKLLDLMGFKKDTSIQSIREMINLMINKGKKVLSVKLPEKFDFYDIDYKTDITNIEKILKEKYDTDAL